MNDDVGPTTILGVDCAVDPRRVGYAIGMFDGSRCTVTEVGTGATTAQLLHDHLAEAIRGSDRVLLALDAPLGWPSALAEELSRHRAGEPFGADANTVFRRITDRHVRTRLGKQPLDVGADRIARTAHAAVTLLQRLREATAEEIPLAWTPHHLQPVSVIEVYPAGTLLAHGIRARGYKAQGDGAARREILDELRRRLQIDTDDSLLTSNADALDATACVLAAQDFLLGRAMRPTDMDAARREGWIWVFAPDNLDA